MKYTLANPELDAQIAGIKRKIRLSMNGIVSDQMIQNGIKYKKNFGVSIPRIKEMASFYIPNHDLALRLWNLEIRETMIMSTLLEPVDSCNLKTVQNMVESFQQIEIVEQACMNLFCKLPYANTLCKEWIQSDKLWIQITGCILAARIYEKLDQTEIDAIIHDAVKLSASTDFHLYKAVGLCLSRFCRKNNETAAFILKEINAFPQSSSSAQLYISAEVKHEMLFLGI